jgi:hypothetical protein
VCVFLCLTPRYWGCRSSSRIRALVFIQLVLRQLCPTSASINARTRSRTFGYDVQPAESTAKFWVKNPGGAIRRKDRMGISCAGSLLLVSVAGPPSSSVVANAKGLESHPPGSAGKASRPATVKLLVFPAASAAHRWLKSVVAMSGFCERGMILPLAGEMGD